MKQKLLNLKSWLLMMCLLVGVGNAWADDVTFTFSDYKGEGTTSTGSDYTMDDKTYVSIGDSKFYGNNGQAHFYAGGTITVTPKNGVTITKIAITTTETSYNGYQSKGTITASTGSVAANKSNAKIVEWTGTATSAFTIEHTKQIRWTSIEVTYTTSGGSSTPTTYNVTVANDIVNGSVTASRTSATADTEITLTATPNSGYKLDSWNVTNASTNTAITVTDNKFKMPAANVNVSATFKEIVTYTVTWSVNGKTNTIEPSQFEEGANIDFPIGLDDVYGKKFVGWSTNENASSASDLVSGKVSASTDATYYAVFATQAGDGTDVLSKITDDNQVEEGVYALITYDKDYYLSNVKSTTAQSVPKVTKDGDDIVVLDAMKWNLSIDNNGNYILKSNASTAEEELYLWGAPTNDGIRIVTTSTKNNPFNTWQLKSTADYGLVLCHNMTGSTYRYLSTYGTQDWRNYESTSATNRAANLYKVVSGYTYSDYTTTVAPIYTLDELSNVSRGEHVNVAVDAEITSVSRTNPVDNLYQVIIKSENNNIVILKIDDADFNWLVGGRVTGTLYDVEWSGVDHGWSISGKSNDYWKALEYTAPVVNTYESIEALRAANLDDNTTVNVTLNDKIANVELVGDTYYVTLDNDFQIVSVTYRDLGWEIGGSISGTLNNVVYSNSGSVDGVQDLNGAYKSLEYTAPVSTYGVTILTGEIENGTVTADKATAAEGETVTLTITPDEGYSLAQLMVYTDYDDIEVVDNKFTMPAADVEIYAAFAAIPTKTYTLSEFAEAANAEEDAIAPGSMVSVSFDNEIVQIDNSEEAASILLKDGDNTFVLMADESCRSDWAVGGTLAGSWNAMYYGQNPVNGAYMLYYADENDPWNLDYAAPAAITYTPQTLTFKATNDDGYWATFSSNEVTFWPNYYVVSAVGVENNALYKFENNDAFDEDIVDIDEENTIDGFYVPANTGVLVYSVDETVTYYTVNGITPSNDVEAVNMLRPSTAPMEEEGYKFYKLSYLDSKDHSTLGFYWGAENGAPFKSTLTNGAYLAVPESAGAPRGFCLVDDESTGINHINNAATKGNVMYNLAGQRVNANAKGIIIVNGKKLFNK